MNARMGIGPALTALDSAEKLAPQTKADLIYRAAQMEMAQRLWRTAVSGPAEDMGPSGLTGASGTATLSLDAMLALLRIDYPQDRSVHVDRTPDPASLATSVPSASSSYPTPPSPSNISYRPLLESAAARTGIAPEAIAAIINAEAARHPDGSWNPQSRNPRSSATGLGQFLNGSWIALAERPGSALNRTAQAQGWIDTRGKVIPGARSALLALRDDPHASIDAVADYARDNISRLRSAGIVPGSDAQEQARAAYLGHHLGPGDAVRFYRGTLDPDRARTLLNAQIGASNASRHIAQAGDPVVAHRRWLTSYVARAVRVSDDHSNTFPPAKI